MGLSDPNQALLNALWSKQLVKESDLLKLFGSILFVCQERANGNQNLTKAAIDAAPPAALQQLNDAVAAINQDLKTYGFDVQKGISESDSEMYYVLCNTNPDELSRSASFFTPVELQFIKLLISHMVRGNGESRGEGHIRPAEIDDLAREYQRENKLKPQDQFKPRELTTKLIDDNWLSQHPKADGRLILGIRATSELRMYLNEQFADDLKECTLCSDVVFSGERCTNERCETRLHTKCAKQWFANRPMKCPSCTNEFRIGV